MASVPVDDARAEALAAAIQQGDVTHLRQLLANNPALARGRIIDADGVQRTLLHVVADWPGHRPNAAATVAALVAAGVDLDAGVINPKNMQAPETALHWAASSDDVTLLDALLDAGADIEAPGAIFTGGSAMSDAVVFAQWKAARRLLQRGAQTTLWQAAALGLLDRVQALCVHVPTPSQQDLTNALWHACRGGQQPVAAWLLQQGADIDWVGHMNKTPVQAAEEAGAMEFADWLRAHDLRRTSR